MGANPARASCVVTDVSPCAPSPVPGRSAIGVGSVFRLRLPLARDDDEGATDDLVSQNGQLRAHA